MTETNVSVGGEVKGRTVDRPTNIKNGEGGKSKEKVGVGVPE